MRRPKRKGIPILRFLIALLIVAFLLLCCVLFLMPHKMAKGGSTNESLSRDSVEVANEQTDSESQITSQEKQTHTIQTGKSKEEGYEEGEGLKVDPHYIAGKRDSLSRHRTHGYPHRPPKHRAHSLRRAEVPSGDSIKDSIASPTKNVTPVKAAHMPNLESVLLIMCANRPDYLKKTLKYVNMYHPRTSFAVVVSEDGAREAVQQVVDEARLEFTASGNATVIVPFLHIHHPSSKTDAGVGEGAGFNANGYFKLSAHYKWALSEVFGTSMVQSKTGKNVQKGPSLRQFSAPFASSSGLSATASPVHFASEVKRVVILEEDLQIAPDFFSYFSALSHMIDTDESLLAVSAWNDNGQAAFVKRPEQLYRSDFFPGLGWMMSRRIWEELGPKWPRAYWDDWLREPPQRKDRHIIRPEICRTFHFGVRGVSNSQFSKFLTEIKLNSDPVDFSSLDLSYLENGKWEEEYIDQVRRADLITMDMFDVAKGTSTEITIQYTSLDDPTDPTSFVRLAQWAGIMDNIKAKVPRTAYHGIVTIWKDGVKLHLQSADT